MRRKVKKPEDSFIILKQALIPVIDDLKTLIGKVAPDDERVLNKSINTLKIIAASAYAMEKQNADSTQEKTTR